MDEAMWHAFVVEFGEEGVGFATGLTDPEVAKVEAQYGFRFPPDLRAFLQAGLPCGEGFPDWRSGDEATLREWFDFPRKGILADVLEYGFWLEEWGTRPASDEETARVVNELVRAAPRLIPMVLPDDASRASFAREPGFRSPLHGYYLARRGPA